MDKLHYHLVSGEVVFRTKSDGSPGSIRLNTILSSKDGTVPVRQIGRAQQLLQINALSRHISAAEADIVDVFIIGVSYLGRMTAQEFQKEIAPEPEPVQDNILSSITDYPGYRK